MNWILLLNSLVVAGATALASALAGFIAALCVAALPRRGRHVAVVLAIVAAALPSFLVTNSWLDLLGTNGLLQRWIPIPIFSLPGAILILSLLNWPIPFLLVSAAWRKVEQAQLEADPALRGLTLVRWVLWPAARPALFTGAAIAFVLALNNFAVPSILQVKVLPAEVWVAFNTNLDARTAFEAGWPMIAAPLLLVALLFRFTDIQWPRESGGATALALRRQLGGFFHFVSAILALCLFLLSLGFPLAQLVLTPRTWSEFLPALIAGLAAIGNSILYAGAAALLAAVLGMLLWRTRAAAISWLLFFIPGVLLGVVLTLGLNRPGLFWFYHTAAVVILAFAVRYLVFAWAAARQAMLGTDPRLADVVRMEGGTGFTLFRHAQWPQVAPQIAAAAYVIYLLCLWDVESLILVVPPGGETLALRIFNLLHYGHNSHVNALCVVLLAVAIAPLLIGSAVRAAYSVWRGKQRKNAALTLAVALIAGCSHESSTGTRIHSAIFSRVEIIGSRGTAPGQFNKPRSVALDTNDNLFVVDMTGRVQKFSPDGKYLLSWQMPQTDLGKPKGMDRDRDGNIVVLEPHYQRVNHFTPEGKLVAQWGHKGTNAGELTLPRAIAVDTKGNVIVSEYTLVDRVQKFAPRGQALLQVWGTPGLSPGQFNRAEGVGTDSADRIYIADSCNHRIQIFSPEGKFLRAYGKPGRGTNELDYPYDIRVDERGRQYVCEFGNSRIQIFDANDRCIEIIGRAGPEPGEFANPWSIALDSKGNLYVADSQNHRVQKFVRKQ